MPMQQSMDMASMGLLDPSGGQDGADPRQRLLQALMLSKMQPPSPSPGPDLTAPTRIPLNVGPIPAATPSPNPAPSLSRDQMDQIHPAGFDQSGMPTEFPATDRMNQARDVLQRTMHPPHELRDSLIRGGLGVLGTALAARHGNTFAGAGAAQGFAQGTQELYNRKQTNIGRAQNMYEFESGQEEKQREAALREKLAMSQLEATKSWRDLLVSMRERGQDKTQETAFRGQNLGMEKAGYDVGPGTSSTAPSVTPKSVDELPEVQQAKIGLENERTKFMQQQELGGGLNLQKQQNFEKMYQARLLGINAMKELRQQSMAQSWQLGLMKAEMPTSSVRTMGETAATVIPHIEQLRQLIDAADKKGLLGPMRGRVTAFLSGKIGSTGNKDMDALLGQLRSSDSLMSSAMLRTHFGARGGQGMYDKFIAMLDTGKATKEMLNGSLDEFQSYAQGYAQAGGVDLANFNAGGSATFNPASMHAAGTAGQPSQPGSSAPTKGSAKASSKLERNRPPKGAKVIEWDQLGK